MNKQSTGYLLRHVRSQQHELSSEELKRIDDDLTARVEKEFPDGIVSVNKLTNTLKNLLALRGWVETSTLATGTGLKHLGFTLVSEVKSRTTGALLRQAYNNGRKLSPEELKRIDADLKKRIKRFFPRGPVHTEQLRKKDSTLYNQIATRSWLIGKKRNASSALNHLGFTLFSESNGETVGRLLNQADCFNRALTEKEIERIDTDLTTRVNALFPDKIVNSSVIKNTDRTLYKHILKRSKIKDEFSAPREYVKSLGFCIASEQEKTSTSSLLWQAYDKKRKLTPQELKKIDADLHDMVLKDFPDGVVGKDSLSSKLKYLLSLRGGVATGKRSTGSAIKALGFMRVIDAREPLTPEDIVERLKKYKLTKERLVRHTAVIKTKDNSLIYHLGMLGMKVTGKYNITAGLEELGFKTKRNLTGAEINRKLLEIWPFEKVKQAYEENDPTMVVSLEEMRLLHKRLYNSMKYRGSSIGARTNVRDKPINVEQRINSLYPEFPHLYSFVSRVTSIDEKALGKRIRAAHYRGVIDIAPRSLLESKDPRARKLCRQIQCANRDCLKFGIEETMEETIARISGLKPKDYSRTPDKTTMLGQITECAAHLVFLVTHLVDPTGAYFQNGYADFFPKVDDVYAQLRIPKKDGRRIKPDLLVCSEDERCAVEVKSGATAQSIKDLPEKYQDMSVFRTDNSPGLDSVVAILQVNERIYNESKARLEDAGIKVVSGEKFMEYFAIAVDQLGCSPCHTYVAGAVPRVHSLANICRFHEQVIENPNLMLRPANWQLISHYASALFSLRGRLAKTMREQKILNIGL